MADRPQATSTTTGASNGTTLSDIPGATLAIHPGLALHREWTLICGFALVVVLAWPAAAGPAGSPGDAWTGTIQFESSTPSDELSVINGRLGRKVMVEGTLSLPAGAKPPHAVG
jgi:hypothetical protein